MTEFILELSTKVYFGTNIWKDALEMEKARLTGNIMIVSTGRSLVKLGYLGDLEQYLKQLLPESDIIIYSKVSQNPKLDEVREAVVIGKANNVQIVIGLGGGSSMDAAKAVAVGIPSEEDIEVYLLKGKQPLDSTLPIIAIPTTAGSGSELSQGAILSSPKHHIKTGIRGKKILPQVAIVDSFYTWEIPEKVTMETGFDVFAHAVESYVAVKANYFSEMLSEKAIRTVGEYLIALKENINNHKAREEMCFASMLMGMNLANVGTCLPHRMQYPIGACSDTSHAAGLATLYPTWIKYEYEVNPEKVSQIVSWMGYGEITSGIEAENAMRKFLEKLGIAYNLSQLGISDNMVEEMAKQVTGNLANDRLAEKEKIIEIIYTESV